MRIVSGPEPKPKAPTRATPGEETLDLTKDTWLLDHCPTWTLPALPMMSMVDRLAGAVLARPEERGDGLTLTDVQVHRWLPFSGDRCA